MVSYQDILSLSPDLILFSIPYVLSSISHSTMPQYQFTMS